MYRRYPRAWEALIVSVRLIREAPMIGSFARYPTAIPEEQGRWMGRYPVAAGWFDGPEEAVQGSRAVSGLLSCWCRLVRFLYAGGKEAVQGRREEETGPRQKGTVWMEGDDCE